jgi:hypothetical protein
MSTQPPPATPVICAASATGPNGAVYRGPVCTVNQAVALRKAGKDIVVCDGTFNDNRDLARHIEEGAAGSRNVMEHPAHKKTAGPDALPHFQPKNRPPEGHSFFETRSERAIL